MSGHKTGLSGDHAVDLAQRHLAGPEAVHGKHGLLEPGRLLCCQQCQVGGHGAFCVGECGDHALSDAGGVPHLVFARDDVFSVWIEETYHLVVPCRLAITLHHLCVSAPLVVVDEERGELGLDGLDQQWIGHHIAAELLAARAAGDLLKQSEHWLARLGAGGQSSFQNAAPVHRSGLFRLRGGAGGAGQ